MEMEERNTPPPVVEDPKVSVRRNLNKYAKRYGMPGYVLAGRCGMANSTLSSYLSGKRYPRPEHLWALASELGIKVADLFAEREG